MGRDHGKVCLAAGPPAPADNLLAIGQARNTGQG